MVLLFLLALLDHAVLGGELGGLGLVGGSRWDNSFGLAGLLVILVRCSALTHDYFFSHLFLAVCLRVGAGSFLVVVVGLSGLVVVPWSGLGVGLKVGMGRVVSIIRWMVVVRV